jgi:hypothetical protein
LHSVLTGIKGRAMPIRGLWMSKKPYRPYTADQGLRTDSSHETEEERDRREYAWELSEERYRSY